MAEKQSQPHQSASTAEKAALRWLIGAGHAEAVDRHLLYEYYCRNGSTFGLQTVARRGAAGRMFYRLEDKGFIVDGRVTRNGRRAAQ